MTTKNAQELQQRKNEVAGCPVNISSYRLGDTWHAKADNMSPGAALARTQGPTREKAEQDAITRATELLRRTRRHAV